MHLVFSVFTPTSTFVLASRSACVYIYDIYVFNQYITILSIDQGLVCSIKFQTFLVFLLGRPACS